MTSFCTLQVCINLSPLIESTSRIHPKALWLCTKTTLLFRGDKLFEAYKGKWIRITDTVYDIRDNVGSPAVVLQEHNVIASFPDSAKDHLNHLNRGSNITLRGQLLMADKMTLWLNNSEIVHE
jgi:hypothetical protein